MTKRLEPIYENVLLDMNPLNWEKTSNPDMSSISFALTSVIKEYESIGYIIEERPHVEIVSSSLKGTDYPECFKAKNGVVISLSAKDDYWFHVKDIPSSHVILKTAKYINAKTKLYSILNSLN